MNAMNLRKACFLFVFAALLFALPTWPSFGAQLGDESAGTDPMGALNSFTSPDGQTKVAPSSAATSPTTGAAAAASDEGTVQVSTYLNVRTSPWGKIIGKFYNGQKVKILGQSGPWYKISYNGGTAYIHSGYVNRGGSDNGGGTTADGGTVPVPGNVGEMQRRIVQEANKLVGRTNFPYAAATNGGRLGCAQVVSTALKAAGVIPNVSLGVLSVLSDLRGKGWREVNVPPYQAGDVITWRTYDRTGDGVKDSDTHIGIIMQNGNSVQAMSNSSSQRMPRLHSATYAPVCRVMRRA